MGLRDFLRKKLSPADYFASSISRMDGFGANGAKPRPWNYDAAIKAFTGWAFAAATLNANAVANVPLRLYARQRKGGRMLYETRKPEVRTLKHLRSEAMSPSVRRKVVEFSGDLVEVVEPHPALVVLDRPNHWNNGYEQTVARIIDCQTTGNSYLHPIIGPTGIPIEIWRMPPQLVSIKTDPKKWIVGYVYGKNDQAREFNPDEVIHFKVPNPADLFYGAGWYQAAWTTLGLDKSKRTMDTAVFDNMARPDWLLTVTGNVQKEALDELEKAVKQRYSGPKSTGGVMALRGDVKAQALNWKIEEQGTPTRIIEEIAAISGVPVAMLLSNDPTKASSQTARIGWYRNTIRPYCRLDEEKLNQQYLSLFEGSEDMFLAYDEVSFEDQQAQATRLTAMVAGGILEPNEARSELGYEARKGGDTLYYPGGTTGVVGEDPAPGDEEESEVPKQDDEDTGETEGAQEPQEP